MKSPFIPLSFPLQKQFIDLSKYAEELAMASQKLGEFNAKTQGTQVSFTYIV